MRSLFPSTSFISIGFPLLPHPRHLFQTCIPYQFPLPHPDTFANHSSSTTNPSLSLRYLSHTRYLFMNPSVLSYHPFLSPSLALPHPAISSFLTVPSFPSPLPCLGFLRVSRWSRILQSQDWDDAEIESSPGVHRAPPTRINHTHTANNSVNHSHSTHLRCRGDRLFISWLWKEKKNIRVQFSLALSTTKLTWVALFFSLKE